MGPSMLDKPDVNYATPPSPRLRGSSLDAADRAAGALSTTNLLLVLRRRRVIFLANALLIPLFALIAIFQITPRYTATGSLIYDPSEYKVRELQSILRADPVTEAVMASQAEILRSRHIAQRVTERGNLYDNPEFNPALRPPGRLRPLIAQGVRRLGLGMIPTPTAQTGPQQDDSRNRTLLAVQDALDARIVKYSRVIEVSFTAQDRQIAASAVNNAMDVYIKDQYAAKQRAVTRASDWLEKRASELRREVRDSEDHIARYRASAGLAQGMHAGLDAEQISHLSEGLAKARGELAEAEARLDAARGKAGAAAQAAIAPSVVQLRLQLEQMVAQAQAQRGRLGAHHPEAVALTSQIAEARRAVDTEIGRVVAATDASMRAARERVAELEHDLRDAQVAANQNAEAQIPLNALQRDVEASRQQLQAVLDRIQQTAQQGAIETPDAHEISLALPPLTPSWPRTGPMLGAAIGLGVFLGVVWVYLLELADTSLRSGEAARTALSLPCFALLPDVPRNRNNRLRIEEYVARKPLSAFAEQVRALRAGLWLGTDRPRAVAVTASRAAEGKTTVALALARSAALSGEHVLVVECDLRQPAFAKRMQASNSAGLADYLRGHSTVAELIQRDALSGCDVILAGRADTDGPDLFLSNNMARLLTELRPQYDLIVLDAPPVQAMTEARILAGIADATLLCIRWGATRCAVAQHTVELLEEAHAHVVGTVLTRVDERAHLRSGSADADVYHRRRGEYARG